MEQFDSSVEESSGVSEQQLRNDDQQCPSCAFRVALGSFVVHLLCSVSQGSVLGTRMFIVYMADLANSLMMIPCEYRQVIYRQN